MASRAKKKKLQRKEILADQGLREKSKKGISLGLYVKIKLILLLAFVVVYFICSPLLIFVAIGFVITFVLAYKTEQRENSSVLKANRLNILKLDAFIGLIVIVIAFGSMASGWLTSSPMSYMQELVSEDLEDDDEFNDIQWRMFWRSLRKDAISFMSLSTGERNIFSFLTRSGSPSFGFTEGEQPTGAPPEGAGGGGRGRPEKIDISDLPIEYLTATILSTVNTVLVWVMFGSGVIGLFMIYRKKYLLKAEANRGIVDYHGSNLSDEQIEKLLSFGTETDSYYDTLDEPIKEESEKIEEAVEAIEEPITAQETVEAVEQTEKTEPIEE